MTTELRPIVGIVDRPRKRAPAPATAPAVSPAAAPAVPKPVKFAKGRLVASGWPDDARMALIIDIDGDGLGDLVAIDPRAKGGIEFARNIRNGKFGAPATGVPIPEAMAIAPFKEIRRRPSPGRRPS